MCLRFLKVVQFRCGAGVTILTDIGLIEKYMA